MAKRRLPEILRLKNIINDDLEKKMDANDQKLEELKESVIQLQATVDMWIETGLPKRTILILLQHKTKLPIRHIRLVLDGFESLYDDYFAVEAESA